MSKFKLIKDIISETPLLNRYLESRGINPEFATKDQKVAHSKTTQFKKWMIDHMNDPVTESMTVEPSPTRKRLAALKRSEKKQQEMRVDGHEKLHTESVDKKDTVTFDIPLLIRVLEFAREELKSDINLHKLVERLISMRGKGTLTMNQYGQIVKEEFEHLNEEQIDEISKDLANRYFWSAKHDEDSRWKTITNASNKQSKEFSSSRHKSINRMLNKSTKRGEGIGRALTRMAKEETTNEAKEANYGGEYQSTVQRVKALAQKKPVDMASLAARMQASYKKEDEKKSVKEGYDDNRTGFAKKPRENDEGHPTPKFKAKDIMDRPHTVHIDGKPWKKFSNGHQANAAVNTLQSKGKKAVAIAHFKESLEPMAACNCPSDGANNPDDTEKTTAKKVKLLLGGKKGVVKEDLYDKEKDDKPSAGFKKPKVLKLAMDSTKEAPQAAAVLKGGKTLTGEPRDTIEIDPMMKTKKPSPSDTQKGV